MLNVEPITLDRRVPLGTRSVLQLDPNFGWIVSRLE